MDTFKTFLASYYAQGGRKSDLLNYWNHFSSDPKAMSVFVGDRKKKQTGFRSDILEMRQPFLVSKRPEEFIASEENTRLLMAHVSKAEMEKNGKEVLYDPWLWTSLSVSKFPGRYKETPMATYAVVADEGVCHRKILLEARDNHLHHALHFLDGLVILREGLLATKLLEANEKFLGVYFTLREELYFLYGERMSSDIALTEKDQDQLTITYQQVLPDALLPKNVSLCFPRFF